MTRRSIPLAESSELLTQSRPLIGEAQARKIVIAGHVASVDMGADSGRAAADMRIAEIRADAEQRIERLRTRRWIIVTVIVCVTMLLAVWSIVIAIVAGQAGIALIAYLLRVERLARAILADARAQGTSAARRELPRTPSTLQHLLTVELLVALAVFVPLIAKVRAPVRPSVVRDADAGIDVPSAESPTDFSGPNIARDTDIAPHLNKRLLPPTAPEDVVRLRRLGDTDVDASDNQPASPPPPQKKHHHN